MNKYSCSLMQDKNSINRMLDRDEYKAYKFIDVFDDITSKGTKIKTGDYLEYGEYPIIDQGSAFISGYLNDNTNLLKDFPLIVFGDHTRCLKYVDFPIYLGADGVKVLKNKLGEDRAYTRFLYYYLKNINIPNTGYNRHFKYLKEVLFVLPPLETQKKIVEVLDKVQALIDARKEQIRLMDELVKSQFIEMFGDPVQNPMRWETKMLSELGNCKNGMNFSADEQGVELKYLGVGDFKNNSKIEDVKELGTISLNQAPSDEYLLQNGDIVFVRSNGNKALVGRSLAVYPNGTPTTFSGFCIRFRKNNKLIEIPYLLQVLKSNSMRMLMCGRGANIQNLNQQILGNLIIPIPPTSLQLHYSEFMRKTEINRLEMQYSFDEINIVYQSLMQQYFE